MLNKAVWLTNITWRFLVLLIVIFIILFSSILSILLSTQSILYCTLNNKLVLLALIYSSSIYLLKLYTLNSLDSYFLWYAFYNSIISTWSYSTTLNKITIYPVLSWVEEWTARSTVEREDAGSNPAQSLDDNHARKIAFLWLFYAL